MMKDFSLYCIKFFPYALVNLKNLILCQANHCKAIIYWYTVFSKLFREKNEFHKDNTNCSCAYCN